MARESTKNSGSPFLQRLFPVNFVETEAEIARKEGRDYKIAGALLEGIKEERGKGGKKR